MGSLYIGTRGVVSAYSGAKIDFTLLDSLQKRLNFIENACEFAAIPVPTLLHARAEEAGRSKAYREQFDTVISRAVANLTTLCEYCLPFVKVGGRFIALKGPDAQREQADAARAVELLGGRVGETVVQVLPAAPVEGLAPMERRLVRIDKVRPTPPKYPRHGSKIAKQPL